MSSTRRFVVEYFDFDTNQRLGPTFCLKARNMTRAFERISRYGESLPVSRLRTELIQLFESPINDESWPYFVPLPDVADGMYAPRFPMDLEAA